jgi:tetratricopeptide (TPR) repeat protein
MALFGAPIAHEDHARRAVLAALGIQRSLREPVYGERAVVRMGLNTGPVVVGSIGDNLRMDYTAVGDTTNLAARLQQLAEPGTVLLGEATHRLVRDMVRVESLGPINPKGKTEAVTAHRLVGLGPRRSPLGSVGDRALSRFVGRERELVMLLELLQQAESGQRTGERWFAAELNRHKGQLLLRQGHSDAAKELYREALSIARMQEARLWELRAASSLAQLWRDQGRRAEARDLLAPVRGWFTEGFETPDLKEAKALLEELGSVG